MNRTPYLAHGLDYQGRHPEASPDINNPDLDAARGIVLGVILGLSLWLVLILAALAIWMPA